MKKIMLAVGHKEFEEALKMKLINDCVFTGIATYREAIIPEAIRTQPEIIIIRETLNGNSNMSDIIYSLREEVPFARIIFITTDRHAGDEFMATLVSYGVYDLVVGTNVRLSAIVELVYKPNVFGDVSKYAAKVRVDEKEGKKIFETKIIQATAPEPQAPKAVIPVVTKKVSQEGISAPQKKKEESELLSDAVIAFSIDGESNNNRTAIRDNFDDTNIAATSRPVVYDDSFYAPETFLTKTSKPKKSPQIVEPPVFEKIKSNKEEIIEFNFDEMFFEIVDESGNPVSQKEPEINVKKDNRAVSALTDISINLTENKDNTYHNDEPLRIIEDIPITKPTNVIANKNEPFIAHKNVNITTSVITNESLNSDKQESKTKEVQNENKVFEGYPEALLPAHKNDRDFGVRKEVYNIDKRKKDLTLNDNKNDNPRIIDNNTAIKAPLVHEEQEENKKNIPTIVQKPEHNENQDKPRETKNALRQRLYPFPDHIKTLIFIRTENDSENHTAINIATSLSLSHKVLFVEASEFSSYNFFSDKMNTANENLSSLHTKGELTINKILKEIRERPAEYIIIDVFIGDKWHDLMLLGGNKFLLIKQSRVWLELVAKNEELLSYARFFTIVIEEYTASGISPKTILSELRPLSVLRISDKKEDIFLAINSKTPAMMHKNNIETVKAYKEILDFIIARRDYRHE